MAKILFNLENFTEGGGLLLNNTDVVWESVRAVKWNYGKSDNPDVLALKIVMRPTDPDKAAIMEEKGISGEQYYSFGSPDLVKKLKIVDGGKSLESKEDGFKLPGNSNAFYLLQSLQNAGCPFEFSDDFSVLDNIVCHMVMRVPPGREDFKPEASFDGSKKDQSKPREVLLVSNFDEDATAEVRGESKPAKKGPTAVAGKGKPAKAAPEPESEEEAAATDDDTAEIATAYAAQVFKALGGKPVSRGSFNSKMFIMAQEDESTADAVMEYLKSDDSVVAELAAANKYVVSGTQLVPKGAKK